MTTVMTDAALPGRPAQVPAALSTYRALTRLGTPLVRLWLMDRRRRGREDAGRFAERFGIAGCARPSGPLVWLHGASVGESLSVLPLAAAIAQRNWRVLLTTGTVTSAGVLDGRLPDGVIHQFVPVDLPAAAARFLAHWRPNLALFAESELWPNLMLGAFAHSIPLGLVNARLSERSARRWARAPRSAAHLLGGFAFCLAQDEAIAARFRALGAAMARPVGNLKHDVPALPDAAASRAALAAAIGGRSVFLAASTHPGEDEIVLAAARNARRSRPDLLTIIAPRHPARGPAIASLGTGQGETVVRRAADEPLTPATTLYVADTLGELGVFYRLATLAFIGGSLVPHGGQNPIEPAKLGVPILHGPHVANFAEVYRALATEDGALSVADGASLREGVTALLDAPARRDGFAERGRACVAGLGGGLARTLDALEPWLDAPRRQERR